MFSGQATTHGKLTMQKKFEIAVVTAIPATRLAAQSQGIPGGMEREAAEGSAVGGPIGKVVGGVPEEPAACGAPMNV